MGKMQMTAPKLTMIGPGCQVINNGSEFKYYFSNKQKNNIRG